MNKKERQETTAMERFLLLLLDQDNPNLIPHVLEWMAEASYHYESKAKQLEYVMTRLLGQMQIPSGDKNYYLGLIDSFSYSDIEYDTFLRMVEYVRSFRDMHQMMEEKAYRTLYDGKDTYPYEEFHELLQTKADVNDLYQNFQQEQFFADFRITELKQNGQIRYGISLTYRFDLDMESQLIQQSFPTYGEQPEKRIRRIIKREWLYAFYHHFYKPLESGRMVPLYRKHGIIGLFRDSVFGPGMDVFIPAEACEEFAEEVDMMLRLDMVEWLKENMREVGLDD